MLYPVIIDKPFKNGYGSKISFKLPQKVEFVKSVVLTIKDIIELENHVPGFPVNFHFELYTMSLILNNEHDHVINDIVGKQAIFGQLDDWNGGLSGHIFKHYDKQKILINKHIIKNAEHYAVFNMPQDMIDYIGINTYSEAFGEYVRNNLQLTLYFDAN